MAPLHSRSLAAILDACGSKSQVNHHGLCATADYSAAANTCADRRVVELLAVSIVACVQGLQLSDTQYTAVNCSQMHPVISSLTLTHGLGLPRAASIVMLSLIPRGMQYDLKLEIVIPQKT